MLKKITKTYQADQKMSLSESYFLSDTSSQKHKNNSFLKAPVLFVGFNPMIHESDSVRSPTSPLDFRIFSSFGSPFRNPRSQNSEGKHRSHWDCSKVGLSILDSSDNENTRFESGKITQFSDSKNILMGRQMRASGSNFGSEAISLELPKSLPANFAVCPGTQSKATGHKCISDVVFEIGESQVEDFRASSLEKPRKLVPSESKSAEGCLQSSVPSGTSHICPIPPSEIQQSEDYTCVTTHGPNPKVTHIFGDCIFDCLGDGLSCVIFSYPSEDFLKFCHSCRKKLDGEDIYIYRGDLAFCSTDCRSEAIESDPEMVETEIWDERNSSLSMNLHPRIT